MDLLQEFEKDNIKRAFPKIKPGDTIRVHQKIIEAGRGKDKKEKERIQVFEGLVVKRHGGNGLDGSFTIRKIASGVGVEKIFPVQMPSIVKIEFVKRGKVRRSNLSYLKDKKEKDARLHEIKLTDKEIKELEFDEEAEKEAKKKAAAEEEAKKKAEAEKKEKAEVKDEPKEEEKPKEEKKEPKESKEKPKEEKAAKPKKEAKAETKKDPTSPADKEKRPEPKKEDKNSKKEKK